MVESPPNPSPDERSTPPDDANAPLHDGAPDEPDNDRLRIFAIIVLIWAGALLLGHAMPHLLDVLFEGLRRPRHLELILHATLFLLAAALVDRTFGANTRLSRPGRALTAGALLLGFWLLFRTLRNWPPYASSPALPAALIDAGGITLLWLTTLVMAWLTASWPHTAAWLARLALLGFIPLLIYLVLVAPIPTFFRPLAAVIFSTSTTDKTAHFWVALALTLLLAAAGPPHKHRAAWLFAAVMIMLLSAPLIELVQGATGRGRELSDALAHAVGTLTALTLLLASRLGAFTPPGPSEASAPDEHTQ